MDAKPAVEVTFEPSVSSGVLKARYSVVNRTEGPVFIFDRMWDRRAKRLDPNWVYAAIDGKTAVLKRTLALMPSGVRMENPPVPYGRELAPGKTATGAFEIRLPVAEANPFDHIRRRKPTRAADVETLKLEIGWCAKSDLAEPGAPAPIKQGGDALWLFGYGVLEDIVKVAASAPVQAKVPALAVP